MVSDFLFFRGFLRVSMCVSLCLYMLLVLSLLHFVCLFSSSFFGVCFLMREREEKGADLSG